MSPEAQRIAIAEVCGWTNLHMEPSRYPLEGMPNVFLEGTPPPKRKSVFPWSVPDYLNDLNAMHEAELVLDWDEQTSTQLFNYRCALTKVCGNDRDLIPFASAWQRAEALLKTLGKWTD